ncbi:hypothetical protein [Aquamicrobium sp.]|uniref:hypothetical protein n=1 Tax=Aquamicrobium sp. TaxID=1872579 RepID=UPI002582DED7|nr:hypothetical protein [Aquamicrobium sp.]MCK9549150.1 hypothetical protein [Aquamicrobium sp.]
MICYDVTFERIGRNRNVASLGVEAADADELAAEIHKYARPHLRSRDYDVEVDLQKGEGFISCGMHCGGRFKIEVI